MVDKAKRYEEELIKRLGEWKANQEWHDWFARRTNELEEFQKRFPLKDLESRLTLDSYCIGRGDQENFCWWISSGTKNVVTINLRADCCGVSYKKDKGDYHLYEKLQAYSDQHPGIPIEKVVGERLFKPLVNCIRSKGEDHDAIESAGVRSDVLLKILTLYHNDDFAPIANIGGWLDSICKVFDLKLEKKSWVEKSKNVTAFIDAHLKYVNDETLKTNVEKRSAVIAVLVPLLGLKKRDKREEELERLVEKTHQVVLTGAPGTGKTYLAKKIALSMLGEDYDLDHFDEAWENALKDGRVGFCQFHPSYDYSDFVEGLRPVMTDDSKNPQVAFERRDGVFKAFCKQAAIAASKEPNQDRQSKYVFIIDEINRGDISKIFGELFFAIDPGYRGIKGRVKTQYQNLVSPTETVKKPDGGDVERDDVFATSFYVPENVYIIGTMNDIDRNVESMDFAIRRRFVWREVKVAPDIVDGAGDILDFDVRAEAKRRMTNLNKKISEEKSLLGEAYQIGPAYFLKLGDFRDGRQSYDTAFKDLWDMNLEPLLREYLRGNSPKVIDDMIKSFKDAYGYDSSDKKGQKTKLDGDVRTNEQSSGEA